MSCYVQDPLLQMDLVFTPSNLLYTSYKHLSIELCVLYANCISQWRMGGGGGGGGSSPMELSTVFILERHTLLPDNLLSSFEHMLMLTYLE